jgi:hypothetical protein
MMNHNGASLSRAELRTPAERAGRGGCRTGRWWWVWLLCLSGLRLDATELTPAQFQAAFVAKAIPYVTWPDNAFASEAAPIVIGLYGGDPFDGLLQKLVAAERSEGRRVEVKVIEDTAQPGPCQVLFISTDKLGDWYQHSAAGVPPGILTIAADETGEFLRRGGVFNLRTGERKLEIDRGNLSKAGLKVSSKLLRIARVQ